MARAAGTGALLECAICGMQFEGVQHLEEHLHEAHRGAGM
jgi:hypothetical protein